VGQRYVGKGAVPKADLDLLGTSSASILERGTWQLLPLVRFSSRVVTRNQLAIRHFRSYRAQNRLSQFVAIFRLLSLGKVRVAERRMFIRRRAQWRVQQYSAGGK